MKNSTKLEDQALQMLLRGEDECLAVLRQQAEQASVRSREMTGVGFFSEFAVPPEAPRIIDHPSFVLGDVHGTAENVNHGVGFVLFVTEGVLSMLEGYTYDEPWPDEIHSLVLSYSTGHERDLEKLRDNIQKRK